MPADDTASQGRLLARPTAATLSDASEGPGPGLHRLGIGSGGRDGLLYVPKDHRPERPAPFALLLHGAGGNADHGIHLLRPVADELGLLLLSVDSRGRTWDVLLGGFGPDAAFLDRALAWTFSRLAVDPSRVGVGGFSDGASYALSLGVTNGDLFTHVLAFSPGFLAPAAQRGRPRVFVSHGTVDLVLPITRCSRRIVPNLEKAGYDVRYREFVGPHTVLAKYAREAAVWLVGPETREGG